jgi:hypothetical protein
MVGTPSRDESDHVAPRRNPNDMAAMRREMVGWRADSGVEHGAAGPERLDGVAAGC